MQTIPKPLLPKAQKTTEHVRGVVLEAAGSLAYVRLDGSTDVTECENYSALSKGDRVLAMITIDGRCVILGSASAKDIADAAIVDRYEEYCSTNSRVIVPDDKTVWSSEVPTDGYMWRRTVTVHQGGTVFTSGAVPLLGDSAIVIEMTTTNGTVLRNSKGSTNIVITVVYGTKRIEDITELKEFFGSTAELVWSELNPATREYVSIPSNDKRISDGGFSFLVSAENVSGDSTYSCNLTY